MKLSGLHFLLTYQCTLECDHCFTWGSPRQRGTMTLADIRFYLEQAQAAGGIQAISFEGGEPFIFYATLLQAVQETVRLGFKASLVTNAFWATSVETATRGLRPFAGLIKDLTLSSDLYHWQTWLSQQARYASQAAQDLGIPVKLIVIAQPEAEDALTVSGQLPEGSSKVMFRGRAAEKLACRAAGHAWQEFTACPFENLRDPGRVHLDPLGNIHICQGITLGNLLKTPLKDICENYHPETHPVIGPLLKGGPAALVRTYGLAHGDSYVDACHLCYTARKELRFRFPETLAPDQMYGGMGVVKLTIPN